eukprot:s1011_g11.t1
MRLSSPSPQRLHHCLRIRQAQESGGGGTVSYVAPSSGNSSSFAVVSAPSATGSARRSTSVRSSRSRQPAAALEDQSGIDRSAVSTRDGKGSRSAASTKRKSSGSAARNESELRLRRQLQHSNEKLDRSEQARTELEGRVKLFQDVLSHRDEMMQHMETYTNRAAHIVSESIAMRQRYHSELESASRQIQEQREQSACATEHFHQEGQELREACVKYVNEREKMNREEMLAMKQRLASNAKESAMNNEMVAEYGRRAVVARDERMAEMQSAINELSESLAKKEEILAQREEKTQEQSKTIKSLKNQASQRSMLTSMDMDNLKFEMNQPENKLRMEVMDQKAQIRRMESENENLKLVETQLRREKQSAIVHENSLQHVLDSLKEENVEIMAVNDSLRTRIAEILHHKMDEDAPSPYKQICDDLREELMKTQNELKLKSEEVASNPIPIWDMPYST